MIVVVIFWPAKMHLRDCDMVSVFLLKLKEQVRMKTDVSVFVVKMLLKPKLSAPRMTPNSTENNRHDQQEWAKGSCR